MDFCTLPVKDFLKKVAEKSATPGGGAVGAVVAALAASLGSMVANLTIGKKGYEDVEGHMESALEVFESESNYLCDLMNRDIQAFDQVMSAYKLPKTTDDEKSTREMKVQQALKTAIEVPFDLARRCKNIILNVERLAKWGNSNVLSDAESAAHLLLAVYRIAKANVMINMKSLKDPDYGAWINDEMNQLEKQIDASYDKIIEIIGKRNG
ncbi:MAG: Methenyl tetrahydrofolate cyclohydrolase [Mesotoga infera]|jgi:formiminotetrahydrofolate cyclodeaminase|uniref:Methenyl tetrahydrofolate cyclohydrolase n=1 Tax=Mesotoga infera TaxID=1236046 RepID=A0A101I7G7_9BACT|nr:MAG: Methenyl tetrahydrofolate cyclohydrolase [Mesotoga infera]KUK89894.1 MAG: Methenyl tetrahydrofolate cyclohydrolase [Mesotoga infera]